MQKWWMRFLPSASAIANDTVLADALAGSRAVATKRGRRAARTAGRIRPGELPSRDERDSLAPRLSKHSTLIACGFRF